MAGLTIECPYCWQKVLVTDGRCPSCNTEIEGAPVSERELLKRKIIAKARESRAKGATLGEIETGLINEGLDAEMVKQIMEQVPMEEVEPVSESDNREMRHALYWLVGGILITVVTYSMASSSGGGGTYLIAWGPMLVGGIRFFKALASSNRRR